MCPRTSASALYAELFKRLSRTRTVIPSLEFAARVNKEIGQGSGDSDRARVTIVFKSNVDPSKLLAARSRALPLEATSDAGYAGRQNSR